MHTAGSVASQGVFRAPVAARQQGTGQTTSTDGRPRCSPRQHRLRALGAGAAGSSLEGADTFIPGLQTVALVLVCGGDIVWTVSLGTCKSCRRARCPPKGPPARPGLTWTWRLRGWVRV